jgi:hypothetical protein
MFRSPAPLLLAVFVYLALALSLAHTKTPWCDEGWFANPAFNLAFRGNMGTSVLEPSGFHLNAYFRGIRDRTYLFPPNHLAALGAWFRLFGASVMTMRAYSICWGALSLAVLFYLLTRFFPDRRVAVAGTLLTSINFVFLWSTADGRPEASANALALCAAAAYLYFRAKDFSKAVVFSQILGACAVFAHPNAVIVILAVVVIAWRYDRARFRVRHLAFAAAPYLFYAGIWVLYILQGPGDFFSQFLTHAAGHNSERVSRLFRPDIAIWLEFVRYFAAYAMGNPWSGVMRGWMAIIPFLYLPAIFWFLSSARNGFGQSARMFSLYAVVVVLGMTFLNAFKAYFYLVYLIPVLNAILAVWLVHLWDRGLPAKSLAATTALAFVGFQLAISILHIQSDEYHRDYQPTIQDLARYRGEGKSIVGTAALGLGLDFSGFKDDVRLGMYSGLNPNILVMDRSYRHFAGLFEKDEPQVFHHIVETLSQRYRLTAQHGSFWIFERLPSGTAPWIDFSNVDSIETSKRAEYFFRLLFAAAKMRDSEESL